MTYDLRFKMLAAIGSVSMDSNQTIMAIQQLAAAVTGTGLIHFTFQDMTLGAQVKHLRTLVEASTTNEWIVHPPVDAEVRAMTISALKVLDTLLVSHRNRIVHDNWDADPTDEHPNRVVGSRATRWSKAHIETDIPTMYLVSKAFFLSACLLGAAERAMTDQRRPTALPVEPGDGRHSELNRYHRELTELAAAIRENRHPTWRWIVTATDVTKP